jgi:nucleoside-diphosphate-sugar epimerase
MSWEDRRVLVTGAAGVIGKALVKRLVSLRARVLSVDIVPRNGIDFAVEHIQTDLSRGDLALVREFSPTAVFHLAATFEQTEEKPDFWESNFDNNVSASHRLFQALKHCSSVQVFLFASSYLAYNPELYLDVAGVRPLTELDSIAPRNLVGLAKYFTERELDFLGRTTGQFRTVSARIFRVYGCGSRDVISRWIRSALRAEPIEVYGRNSRFDYVYADDVAEGLIKLGESPAANGVINLGSGIARAIADVVGILKEELKDLQVRDVARHGPTEGSCASMQRFRELTEWMPRASLEDGIRNVIAYEKAKAVAGHGRQR